MLSRFAFPLILATAAIRAEDQPLTYPETKKGDTVDTHHGVQVPDPYRWLEDDNSAETKAWVEAQNKVTFGFLEQIPQRAKIRERLMKLWNLRMFHHAVQGGRTLLLPAQQRAPESKRALCRRGARCGAARAL